MWLKLFIAGQNSDFSLCVYTLNAVEKASDPDSRLRRVEWVGAVTNVLGAVEDPVGQTSQEVSGGEITCDRPHREP